MVCGGYVGFPGDDGWAVARHIALSTLMALFPFLIFITSLTGLLGSQKPADQVAFLLLDTWPAEVAGPISSEIAGVLTNAHGGLLTFGVALAIYFSSSGVESLRIGLNRAYAQAEPRPWWLLRLETVRHRRVGAAGRGAPSFIEPGAAQPPECKTRYSCLDAPK